MIGKSEATEKVDHVKTENNCPTDGGFDVIKSVVNWLIEEGRFNAQSPVLFKRTHIDAEGQGIWKQMGALPEDVIKKLVDGKMALGFYHVQGGAKVQGWRLMTKRVKRPKRK